MKIRSIEELEDKLEADIAWRKKEILSLKILIDTDDINKKILMRAGIALLCAHFEGFIKTASNLYIVYISNKKIEARKIINSLVAIKLKNNFISCGKTEKHSVHGDTINKFEKIMNENFCLKYTDDSPIISTNSNPTPEVLKEILKTIGIESDIFRIKEPFINYSLLNNRHKVVHGDKHELNYADFIDTHEIVLEMIDNFRDLIINAAENELFLKEKQNIEITECV